MGVFHCVDNHLNIILSGAYLWDSDIQGMFSLFYIAWISSLISSDWIGLTNKKNHTTLEALDTRLGMVIVPGKHLVRCEVASGPPNMPNQMAF